MSKTKSSTSSSSESVPTISKLSYTPMDYTKIRILQKNVVYVIGLSSSLADKDILSSWQYFGQYGKIMKIVVNKNGYSQNFKNDTTYSAYVSYSTQEEASLALLAIDNCVVDGHVIRGSFGTTKYCTFFLKGIECANKECLYLHEFADEEDTILKDEISGANKQLFYKQQKIAIRIADIFNKEKKNRYLARKSTNEHVELGEGFPPIESIYDKEIIYEIENEIKYSYRNNTNNDYDFGSNDNEEEMEYVLVREPRQMNKSKAFKKRKRNYKFNRRMTDYSDSSKDKAIIRNFGDSSSNNENSEKIPYRKLTYDS